MEENQSTEQFRLFVAIPVPDPVRNAILAVQRELQSAAPHGAVRWTRSEQFHLTLRFLGDVPPEHVGDLRKSIQAVCAGLPILSLCARGVGFFPNARSPRVLWAGISDKTDRLAGLQREIENAVRPFSQERGCERFAGHITLGRFKPTKGQNLKTLQAAAKPMDNREFGDWTAGKIEVIRSELLPSGSRYTPIIAVQLGTKIAPK